MTITVVIVSVASLSKLMSPSSDADDHYGIDDDRFTINSLSATSTEPGNMILTWDEADPVPSRYRVTWGMPDQEITFDAVANADLTEQPSFLFRGLTPGEVYRAWVQAEYERADDGTIHLGPWSPPVEVIASGIPSDTKSPEQRETAVIQTTDNVD